MSLNLPALIALVLAAPAVETRFVQVAPVPAASSAARAPGKERAVILLHGLTIHPFSKENVARATFHDWQAPDSLLVKRLVKDSDVYAFAYSQNAPADEVAASADLAAAVRALRDRGYRQLVLVGHSAGGLIARHLVEDHPDSGVTKVIQVCSPNGGSPLATSTVPKSQRVFVECLSVDGRRKCLELRGDKRIPEKVQFVCVIARAKKTSDTDGVVPCGCQWTADLHKQGIPAACVVGGHREVVRDAKFAETLAGLVREKHDRWPAERIAKAKKEIFGK